jgi:Tol biopolymer transport system component
MQFDSDGSDLRWIFGTDDDETEPTWSPTDDIIVFLSDADTVLGSDVYTVRSDGTGLTRLTEDAGYKHPT